MKWRKRIATLTIVASLATFAIVATPSPLPMPDPRETATPPLPLQTPSPSIATARASPMPPPAVRLLRLRPAPAPSGILVDYRSNAPRIMLFVQDANDIQKFAADLPGTGTTILPLASLPKNGGFSIVVQARRGDAVGAAEIAVPSAEMATGRLHPIAGVPTTANPVVVTPRWVVTGDIVTISRYAALGTTTVTIKRADESDVAFTTLPPGRRTAFIEAPEPGRYTVNIATSAGSATDTSILSLVVIASPRP